MPDNPSANPFKRLENALAGNAPTPAPKPQDAKPEPKRQAYTGPALVPVDEEEENQKYMTKSLEDVNRKLSKAAVRSLPRLPNRNPGR